MFRKRSLLALALVLAMVLAACGDDSGSSSSDTTGSGSETGGALSEIDLGGASIAVGSKDFTEQQVLGYIQLEALKAAGANVTDKVNLGGTVVARKALENGDIDVYAEYNGTGWTVHLGNEKPSDDPETLTQNVREADLAQNGIDWIGRAPFNDTYGFAMSKEFADSSGVVTLEDMANYLKDNSDATVCLESEFPERPDGLVLFEDAYGVKVDNFKTLDTGIIYSETANGNCDFGEIFTTDGRIPALDLQIVEDPGVFIIYNISMNVRDEIVQEVGRDKLEQVADLIFAPLTNDRMAELNKQVSVDGDDPQDVAKQYLADEGLV